MAACLVHAVLKGCLQSLPASEAAALCSGLLVVTDGVPAVLMAAQQHWAQNPQQLAELPAAVCQAAGHLCTSTAGVLRALDWWLGRNGAAAEPDRAAAGQQAGTARQLRDTAGQPELVILALDALTCVLEPDAGNGWAAAGELALCPLSAE